MIRRMLPFVVLFMFLAVVCASSQQASTQASTPQATAVIQSALTAMAPTSSIQDVTLNASVRAIAGADDETGTAILKAMPGAFSRIELNLPSNQRTETVGTGTTGITGAWAGADGTSHAIAPHNLMAGVGWFFPLYVVGSLSSNTGYAVSFVAYETRNGKAVAHLRAFQPHDPIQTDAAPLLNHLSTFDVYLDKQTLLPTALTFNLHPDKNAALDIPVEVQYSSYQTVSGVAIPHHIVQYVNGTLSLDMQVESAAINTGLTAAVFSANPGTK